jgi:hypothetical protein
LKHKVGFDISFQEILKAAEEAFENWASERRGPSSHIGFISGYMMAIHKMGLYDFEGDEVGLPYNIKNKLI